MTTLTYKGELTVVRCWCGISLAVPADLRRHQLDEQDRGRQFGIFCPLGHEFVPKGPSRLDREREMREHAETSRRALLDQLAASERSRSAVKGALTKAKRRALNGVCPCCHRTFPNVQAHIASKHPGELDKAQP